MAKAPKVQPFIKIPDLENAKKITMKSKGQGEALHFQMFVGKREIHLDPDSEWMGRDWIGLVIRELDRLNVWKLVDITQRGSLATWTWLKRATPTEATQPAG